MMHLNSLLAALVLYAVVYRLAHAHGGGASLRSKISCQAWVAAHVFLGTGCVALIAVNALGYSSRIPMFLLLVGLSILLLFKWQRRTGDPK